MRIPKHRSVIAGLVRGSCRVERRGAELEIRDGLVTERYCRRRAGAMFEIHAGLPQELPRQVSSCAPVGVRKQGREKSQYDAQYGV